VKFFEPKRPASNAENREIKHEDWKTFCEGTDKFTNPSYIWATRQKRNIMNPG
jgi:hypothetical protein